MNLKTPALTILLLAVLLFTGCAFPAGSRPAQQGAAATNAPTALPTITSTRAPTRTPLPTATPTLSPQQTSLAAAEAAARDYFANLSSGDFKAASELVSNFSLLVFGMTRGDVAAALAQQRAAGSKWSDFEITDAEMLDENTSQVHVRYQLAALDKDGSETSQTVSEAWPFRLENGQTRYNWNNLVDFHTLDVLPQTLNGVTVKPVQANRFTDRFQLVLLVQNRTNAPVVFGQVNEILATFYFDGQPIQAEPTQTVFAPLRTYLDYTLQVKGSFARFPESVEIRKWKNYNVAPWFTFQLQ